MLILSIGLADLMPIPRMEIPAAIADRPQ